VTKGNGSKGRVDTIKKVVRLTSEANGLSRGVAINVRFKEAMQQGRYDDAEVIARALFDRAYGVLFRAYLIASEKPSIIMVRKSLEYLEANEKEVMAVVKEAMGD